MLSNADALNRFLLHLPANSQFNFTDSNKKDIRKALFWALAHQGEYLQWVFPLASQNDPLLLNVVSTIDQFDWLFKQYSKYSASFKKEAMANSDPSVEEHSIQDHRAFHSNMPCARIFRKGEPIYRCLTCGYDDVCALCSYCYKEDYHKGHKVHITICQRENGGVCDCGDPEAWVKEYKCPYSVPMDLLLLLLGSQIPPPKELQESFLETIEILLDYVIDVMVNSNLQFQDPTTFDVAKIHTNTFHSCLNSAKYGYPDVNAEEALDRTSGKYYLMVYNDQIRHYRDAVQRIYLASKKIPQFAAMVADKVQSFGKAKVISSKDTNLLLERQKILSSTGLATSIRSHRDVFREDMVDEILLWFHDLTESDMFKSHLEFRDLFCLAFCRKWKPGLLHYAQNSNNTPIYTTGALDSSMKITKIPTTKRATNFTDSSASDHWNFTNSKWNLPHDICESCDYNKEELNNPPPKSYIGSRFQYFCYLDIRFWKSMRIILHDMFSTSLITNLKFKHVICSQYVDIYPEVADMFLTLDREPEYSIMCTLLTQLFTCPSNSTEIVTHGDMSRIFATIYSFLTVEEIRSPENIELSHEISMKSLKNRKWGQIFFDIGYILSRSKNSSAILNGNIIPMACDILALFQGRPVMKRESKSHIEYENPDYTAFFHAILVIYQFADHIANCVKSLEDTTPQLKKDISIAVIKYVLQFLLKLENNEYPGLIDEFVDIHLDDNKKITTELTEGSVIQSYSIDKEKVSFLHPIHSFLSWLIEHTDFNSPAELKNTFLLDQNSFPYLPNMQLKPLMPSSSNVPTTIFEYSIRTIVLMSQIKSGFWVRNGFSVRSQLQLYKNTGLRESGYLRDMFLSQVFISTNSPNLVCFMLFNRWLLMEGFMDKHQENDMIYDSQTLPYMIEECINTLIHLSCEDLHLRNLSNEEISDTRVRLEILHNICFGPTNYTKLCMLIPDHISCDKKFDIILEELTTFTSPTGSTDIGMYELREEYYSEIDPYYFNYTTNTKEDAIKLVKERLCKTSGKSINEVVITPKIRNAEELGVYRYIGNFALSSYFADFVICTINYINKEGIEKLESLLETLLHLIHICSFEETIDLATYGSFYKAFLTRSDIWQESIASQIFYLLQDEKAKKHHSKIKAIYNVFQDKYGTLVEDMQNLALDFSEKYLLLGEKETSEESSFHKKKLLAKERQKKLMEKFKRQQSLFLENNTLDDSGTDIEMENVNDDAGWRFPESHCLLCQNATEDSGPFGIVCHFSKSSEFRSVPFDDEFWTLKAFSDNVNLNVDENSNANSDHPKYTEGWTKYMKAIKNDHVVGPGFDLYADVNPELVSLSCGHGMHYQCYINYLNSNRNRVNQITRNTPERSEHKEFLCPLCKSLCNMFVPILWATNNRPFENIVHSSDDLYPNKFNVFTSDKIHDESWFKMFKIATETDIAEVSSNLSLSALEYFENSLSNASQNDHFTLLLTDVRQMIAQLKFPVIEKLDASSILMNTIKSVEISLRGVSLKGLPIVCQIGNNSLINMRTLNEFNNSVLYYEAKKEAEFSNESETSYEILANLMYLADAKLLESILERDFFKILVTSFPLPSFGISFSDILRVCFVGHVIQSLNIIVTKVIENAFFEQSSYSIFDFPKIDSISKETSVTTLRLFKSLHSYDNSYDDITNDVEFGEIIFTMLLKSVLPFLRRTAIYAFVNNANVDSINFDDFRNTDLEADALCRLLGLKSLEQTLSLFNTPETFENSTFVSFVKEVYLQDPSSRTGSQIDLTRKMEFPGIIKLCDLPERLDFFFSEFYYLEMYDNPYRFIENPGICLYCGTVVDAQKTSLGTKQGQCTTHYTKECANSVGIFLFPKERCLLLLNKNGGSFFNAPFLDQHGELASEAKRGKALFLMNPRYNEFIRSVWLQHDIPNIITRKLESVIDAGGWETL